MQTLEEMINEKYELNNSIEKLKRKLRIQERALEFLKKEINEQLNNEKEEVSIQSIRKAMHDF